MLSLDSSRWSELTHAYGSAADVPQLLAELEKLPPETDLESEPYFTLWSALCHQGDVYTASYAAVPHIVRIIGLASQRIPWSLFQMIACIEIARCQDRGPAIPADLQSAYEEALRRVPELVGRTANASWDHWYCGASLAAIAAAKGFAPLAEAILELDPDTIKKMLQRKFGESL